MRKVLNPHKGIEYSFDQSESINVRRGRPLLVIWENSKAFNMNGL